MTNSREQFLACLYILWRVKGIGDGGGFSLQLVYGWRKWDGLPPLLRLCMYSLDKKGEGGFGGRGDTMSKVLLGGGFSLSFGYKMQKSIVFSPVNAGECLYLSTLI